MAGEDDLIELKFRLADGSDIGPGKYSPDTAVASLKEKVVSQWPRGSCSKFNHLRFMFSFFICVLFPVTNPFSLLF